MSDPSRMLPATSAVVLALILVAVPGHEASSSRMAMFGNRGPYRMAPPMMTSPIFARPTAAMNAGGSLPSATSSPSAVDSYYVMPSSNWFFPGSRINRADADIGPRDLAVEEEMEEGNDDNDMASWQNDKRVILPPIARYESSRRQLNKPVDSPYDPSKPASTSSYSFFKMMG